MKRTLSVVSLVVFVGLGFGAWFNRLAIFDWYRLRGYEPSARIQELVEEAGMSEEGERLFLVSHPVLMPEDQFDEVCEFAELGLVLGCYSGIDIFILDVNEKQLETVEPVTAAHEMLHVVYDRMNGDEINSLQTALDTQLTKITNTRILKVIDGYRDDPNADIYNEMHSIFGTEQATLIPELEEHYKPYFADRSKVLKNSDLYEKVFIEIENRISGYDKRLKTLSRAIESLENDITLLGTEIEAKRTAMDNLKRTGNISAYNAMVPQFNSLVNEYNADVMALKDDIKTYNSIVAKRNANVVEKNDLIKELNSDLETI